MAEDPNQKQAQSSASSTIVTLAALNLDDNFTHEPLAIGSIRVLTIHRDLDANGFISCDIVHSTLVITDLSPNSIFDLDFADGVEYKCLSYTWGDATIPRQIKIGDKLLSVSSNLWEFLDMFRTHEKNDVPLWIDQICIDQQNIEERNQQVQRMGEIYSESREVIVWLGTPLKYADEEVALMIREIERHEDIGVKCQGDTCAFCYETATPSLALLDFIRRPYWYRIWIIQELRLSRSETIFMGSHQIPGFQLYNAVIRVSYKHQSHSKILGSPEFFHMAAVVKSFPAFNQQRSISLATAIAEFSGSGECKDPRDIIYGLQGIVVPEERVEVDYGLASRDLFDLVLDKIFSRRMIRWEVSSLTKGLVRLSRRLGVPSRWQFLFPAVEGGELRNLLDELEHTTAINSDRGGDNGYVVVESMLKTYSYVRSIYKRNTGLNICKYFAANSEKRDTILRSLSAFEHHFVEPQASISSPGS